MNWMPLLFFALLALLLWRNLPGALAFLRPGWLRVETISSDASLGTPATRQMERELAALGFSPLGTLLVGRPLERRQSEYLLASEADRSYAVVFPRSGQAWLRFVTPLAGGGRVVTADHRVTPVDQGGYVVGGLPGVPPDELWAAHRKRVERVARGKKPSGEIGLQEWIADEQDFYTKGAGKDEIRRREARRFVFTAAGIVWGLWTVLDWTR